MLKLTEKYLTDTLFPVCWGYPCEDLQDNCIADLDAYCVDENMELMVDEYTVFRLTGNLDSEVY